MLDLYKKIIITYKMLNCIQFKWVTKCCSGSCLSPWVWQVLGQSRTTALNQLTPTVTFFQNQITLLQWALQSVQCTTSSGLRTLIWVNKKKRKKRKEKKKNIAASGNPRVLTSFAPNRPPWPSSSTVDDISRRVAQRSVQYITMTTPSNPLQIGFSTKC